MEPLGVGLDAEEVARWQSPDLRLFTATERAHCTALANSAESFAGRWCAKEAVVKALALFVRTGIRDVEIVAAPDGRPVVHLDPRLAGLGLDVVVSITHTASMAFAVAVARQNSPSSEVR